IRTSLGGSSSHPMLPSLTLRILVVRSVIYLRLLSVFDFAAKERGGEFMRLVTHHQIPAAIRSLKLLLYVFIARELVQAGNDQVVLQEPVASARHFQLVIGQDVEGEMETAV